MKYLLLLFLLAGCAGSPSVYMAETQITQLKYISLDCDEKARQALNNGIPAPDVCVSWGLCWREESLINKEDKPND